MIIRKVSVVPNSAPAKIQPAQIFQAQLHLTRRSTRLLLSVALLNSCIYLLSITAHVCIAHS